MNNQFQRSERLLGSDLYRDLRKKKIIVFGVGGVGSAAIDAIVRMGFESVYFVDYDVVDISNLNRQIFTNLENVGMYKCIAMQNHIKKINKDIEVHYKIKKIMYNIEEFELEKFDYVIDAIDSITAKINLAHFCYNNNIPLISSMGSGNRLDANAMKVMDIFDTKYDPLSRVMRRELKSRGVKRLKVVSSDEKPYCKSIRLDNSTKSSPSSVSFVPPVSGYIMVSEVVKELIRG